MRKKCSSCEAEFKNARGLAVHLSLCKKRKTLEQPHEEPSAKKVHLLTESTIDQFRQLGHTSVSERLRVYQNVSNSSGETSGPVSQAYEDPAILF